MVSQCLVTLKQSTGLVLRHLLCHAVVPSAVPRCRQITFGRRAFSVAGLMVWNPLVTEFQDLSVGFYVFRLRRYYLHDISAYLSICLSIYLQYLAVVPCCFTLRFHCLLFLLSL